MTFTEARHEATARVGHRYPEDPITVFRVADEPKPGEPVTWLYFAALTDAVTAAIELAYDLGTASTVSRTRCDDDGEPGPWEMIRRYRVDVEYFGWGEGDGPPAASGAKL